MAWWAGLLAGGAQAGGSALGNLWAAKERRRSQEWGEKMYQREVDDNRINSDIAYNRSLDYGARIAAAKGAGINPYTVAGDGYNAPVAQGGNVKAGPMAPGDFSGIGMIPQAVMQMKLLQAQKDNIDADTRQKTSLTTGQDIQNKYAGILNETQIANMKQMTMNAEETQKLLKEQTRLTNLQGLEQWIDNQTRRAQNNAMLAKTEGERFQIDKYVQQIDAQISKVRTEIQSILQQVEVGKMSVKEAQARIKLITAQTVTENKTRNTKTAPNSFWGTFNKWGEDMVDSVDDKKIRRDR